MIVQAYFLKFQAFLEQAMPLQTWSKTVYKTRLPRLLRQALEDFGRDHPEGLFCLSFLQHEQAFCMQLECLTAEGKTESVFRIPLAASVPGGDPWFLFPGYTLSMRYPLDEWEQAMRRSRLPGELRDLLANHAEEEETFSLEMVQDDSAAALIYSTWTYRQELFQRRVLILGYRQPVRTAILIPQTYRELSLHS